jgi:hypothetical protein
MDSTNPVSYALTGATGYEAVVRRLQRALEQESGRLGLAIPLDSTPPCVAVRPVVLIFGKPSCPLFREELLPEVAYLHFASGNTVELFCMGYPPRAAIGGRGPDILIDGYDDEIFVAACQEFQQRTTWHYSGETDLILLQAYLTPFGARLDLGAAVPVHLEKEVRDGVIPSARVFVQRILQSAERVPPQDVVNDVSDGEGLRSAGTVLGRWAAGVIGVDYDAVKSVPAMRVRDIRRSA